MRTVISITVKCTCTGACSHQIMVRQDLFELVDGFTMRIACSVPGHYEQENMKIRYEDAMLDAPFGNRLKYYTRYSSNGRFGFIKGDPDELALYGNDTYHSVFSSRPVKT